MSFRIGMGLGLIPVAARPTPTTAPVNDVAPSFPRPWTQGQTVAIDAGSWSGLPSGGFEYMRQRWNGSAWVDVGSFSSSPNITFDSSDYAAGPNGVRPVVKASNIAGPTVAYGNPITVAAPLTLTGTPPAASVGSTYSFVPTSGGGRSPKSYAFSGTLLPGLGFSTTNGEISGVPTTTGTASGLNITVTDADGLTQPLGVFSLVVNASGGPTTGHSLAFNDPENSQYVPLIAA